PRTTSLDLNVLAEKLKSTTNVHQNDYLLRFTPDKNEITVFRDGRAIIKGTDEISHARSLYARYIGF
ncbi:MAG: thiazole biosynthesis adenylyltransferase ThiF, partial [Pyrinomonadaceae bacterium]